MCDPIHAGQAGKRCCGDVDAGQPIVWHLKVKTRRSVCGGVGGWEVTQLPAPERHQHFSKAEISVYRPWVVRGFALENLGIGFNDQDQLVELVTVQDPRPKGTCWQHS